MLAVGRAGHPGGALPQQVFEQLAAQVLPGHLGLGDGEGDGEGLAALGVLVGRFQRLDIKVHSNGVVGNLHRLQVQGGVLGLGIHLPVDGLEIRVLLLALGRGEGQIARRRPVSVLRKAIFQGDLEIFPGLGLCRLPVHCDHRGSLGHHQLVVLHLIAVVPGGGVYLFLHPVHQVGQGGVVLGQGQGHLAGHAQHVAHQLRPANKKVSAADVPGVPGALGGVNGQLVGGQALLNVLILQGKGDIAALLFHRILNGFPSLLHRHVGDVNPRHRHVGQNGTPARRPGTGAQVGRRQKSHHRAGDDPGQLAAARALVYSLSIHI